MRCFRRRWGGRGGMARRLLSVKWELGADMLVVVEKFFFGLLWRTSSSFTDGSLMILSAMSDSPQ